jgi:heterodisulfide reductase subunit C2
MKASRAGTADLDRILSEGSIWKCQQCGLCSGICPSEKAGGIRPIEVLTRASQGVLDLREDRSIWLCAVCNSCTERCQMDVDPSEIIMILREEAAALGSVPKHFSEEAKLFVRSGLSFPNTGMTKKLRKDLGLEDLTVPAETMEHLAVLVKRTRLGGLKLE